MSKYSPTWRCNECGRFAKIVDSYTPFGNSEDAEPPETHLLCQKCVDKLEAEAKKTGRVFSHWLPAEWETKLIEELRRNK